MAIPERCKNMKVANSPLFSWWCKIACGGVTGGRMCRPWCNIAQKYGLWTLAITLPAPLIVLYIVLKVAHIM